MILISILLDQSSQFGIRQLAGVLFKQYVEVHWSQNSEKFQDPEIDPTIKQRVRQIIPIGLSDENSKIRTTSAYSISKIASWDWPELWPELFEILLSALNGSTFGANNQQKFNLNSVHGSLETLVELVPDITDLQMPQVAPVLIPQLYKIFIDPANYSISLRRSALEIFTTIVNVIAEMSEYDPSVGKKYLYPYVPDFVFAMIKAISLGENESQNVIDFSLKKEIVKALAALLRSFPKKLGKDINEILTHVWNCLVQSSQVYVNKIVNSESANDDSSSSTVDFEEEKKNFENLVYQLFDFILILKDMKKYKPIIKKAIEELCFYAILYMQMTDEQVCEIKS